MSSPPPFCQENFQYIRSQNLAAFARPTQARYLTRPLSNLTITVLKQLETVHLEEEPAISRKQKIGNEPEAEPNLVQFAGCGTVGVKRTVHGYKKLSLINRTEIGRAELTLPPIEYDTFGIYFCVDFDSLNELLGEKFGHGVHALSHALLAVAPLFAPGLSRDDIETDHSTFGTTQLILFDQRAGGSGCVERLWKSFFQPNGILEAAIDLLENCSMCNHLHDSGCPACLHAPQCLKFNLNMSRSAAIIVGKRMLDQIKRTALYQENVAAVDGEKLGNEMTPRRRARLKALKTAKEMHSARERQFMVGRPSWPMDQEASRSVL